MISRNLSLNSLKPKGVRYFNVAANTHKAISDDAFKVAEIFNNNNVQGWNITLSKYLKIISSVKGTNTKTNSLSSRFKNKKEKITYRKSLYYRFNAMQISMVSDVLKKMFDRMDATKAEVVFTFHSGTESLPISPMGQYYLARKLLKKDLYELSRSSFFGGAAITHEDLITAGLETGLVNSDMLDSALKIDDLWNPEVQQWKKIADYGFRVSGTATIFLPPPFNVISSIALVFIEGLVYRKSNNSNQSDNSYDFF